MASAGISPNIWLGGRLGYLSDAATQCWVRTTGRRVCWDDEQWLRSPSEPVTRDAAESDGAAQALEQAPGLMPTFAALDGNGFDSSEVHPSVVGFYEQTSLYRLDVWSRWSTPFRPFGWLLAWIYSRRLDQLNIPLDPLDAGLGMTSRVLRAPGGDAVVWRRHLHANGRRVYEGHYGVGVPTRLGEPCVRVAFPLPNGSATVFLRPSVLPGGGLRLLSAGRGFGDAGFYFTLAGDGTRGHARFVRSARECIDVFVDDAGRLRADHVFSWFNAPVFRLRYAMTREGDGQSVAASSSASAG